MNTQATVAVKAARKAVYDKVESQIHTFEAQVATLKAKAESAKADAELDGDREARDGDTGARREGRRVEERRRGHVRAGEGRRRTSLGGVRQVAAGARVPDQRVTNHADARVDVGDLRNGRRHRRRHLCGDPAPVRTRHRVGGDARDSVRSAAAEAGGADGARGGQRVHHERVAVLVCLVPLNALLKRYFEAMVGFTQPFFITP